MAVKINLGDLEFILRQVKISEAHANGTPLTEIYADANGNVVPEGTPGAVLAISSPLVPNGLRTVDGTYNNLTPGREAWGAADTAMPRLLDPSWRNENDDDFMPLGPPGGPVVTNNDYGVIGVPSMDNGGHTGNVADADPRIISNLVVDQSVSNPAAVEAWFSNDAAIEAFHDRYGPDAIPVRPGDGGGPNEIEIDNQDMSSLLNIAPDDGISAPFNAWMTFFGQFFDHGLDLITKKDNGSVFIPLRADDPLVVGADGAPGGGDDLAHHLRFMVMTRSAPTAGPGADGMLGTADDTDHEGQNTTTPFVDQNQTYTSHPSHQVFLRAYTFDAAGNPVSTGDLLDGANGGLPTWAEIKAQARDMLGIELTDGDVLNIPLLRTDQYGAFIPGANGLPQIVIGLGPDGVPNTADDEVLEGNLTTPINTFAEGAVRIGHAFLDDIAHTANPFDPETGGVKVADDDADLGPNHSDTAIATYDNEMLDRHFITGDGRGNENIGLTAVHHIFHSEHNRQVEAQKHTILETGDIDFINEWLAVDLASGDPVPTDPAAVTWDGERLFQSARFATEMQYQHLVFEEFARKIHPNIDPFVFNAVTDINPSIFAEFANVVYRFGHSMLTDNMPRLMVDEVTGDLVSDDMGLIGAFLNPIAFDSFTNAAGETQQMSADEAAAAVIRGMTVNRGSQIDEFVVSSLRNNLLGLPLDLAAINIARGRDTGIPSLNDARAELYQQTNSVWLRPYESWVDLASNLKTPATVVNLIAAYGNHATIDAAMTLEAKRDAAFDLVFGGGAVTDEDRFDFLLGRGAWNSDNNGLNDIDLWVGGMAERIMPFGGMLGSTFTAVFEAQLEALQDGDRFYYLTRTQGQNLLNQLEENSFANMLLANTSLSDPGPDGIRGTPDDIVQHHIGVDSFARYDYVLEINEANQLIPDPVGNDPVLEGLGMGKVVRDDPTTAEVETNYLRFTGGEHVVVGGTSGNDTIITGDGDDGIWGDDGDDFIESGFGVDLVNGGGGNDIILDAGDEGDFLKGEDGDDVMATANGADVLMGGFGKDVIFLGADASEVFGGGGDDFIMGGDGADFLLGNEGNDWIEAGPGFDTTAGDNSELFFNSKVIGHDVMFAGSDEHDFDAESGDDIMVQGASVMRNEGMFGFDWVTFKDMPVDAYADMRIKIFTTDEQDILRNRFDKVEALSGWDHNDTLIGDNRVAPTEGEVDEGAGGAENIFFNDGLDQAGIDRIDGLSELVSIVDGEEFWESGNIILGGRGSDVIQGNGGDDVLDGDRWLNVRIRITDQPGADNTAANEIASVDSLRHVFTDMDMVDPSWEGKSLFELLVSRTVVPSQMNIVREILDGGEGDDLDIAVFNDNRDQYTVTNLGSGVFQVDHTGFGTNPDILIDDGIDTLHNIETLRFADGDVFIGQEAATGQPIINDQTPTEGQALTVDLSTIADANIIASPIEVQWQSFDGTTWVNIPGATATSFTPNDLPGDVDGPQVGREMRVMATFTDELGGMETVFSDPTAPVGDLWFGQPNASTFAGTAGDDIAVGHGRIVAGGILISDGSDNIRGGAGDDLLIGGSGADRLAGNQGNDTIDGGNGRDVINGGGGDDLILFNFEEGAGGRDLVNGGGGTDTVEITGNGTAETYRIYTRAEALAISLAVQHADTEIVITRNGTTTSDIIAQLRNVEEIIINGSDATPPANGVLGGDTIEVFGNFSQTSLNLNTITINGTSGNDTVDITSLSSAHRIVFRGEGGNDTIVGTVREQDVIELPGEGEPTVTTDEAGMVTVSRGGASVTFDGAKGIPGVETEGSSGGDAEEENEGTEQTETETETQENETQETEEGSEPETGSDENGISVGANIVGSAAGGALFGAAEADNILALGDRDMIFAGDGDDNVLAGDGADMVFGDGGNDRLLGEGGDDFIEGGTGDDLVIGGSGDDLFIATEGDGDDAYYGDDLSGGIGTDTLDMSRIIENVTVDLGSSESGRGYATSESSGSDTLWSIENFLGGSGDDVITAGRSQNMMDGGDGEDTYRFLSAEDADGDIIGSFQPGDKIDLEQIDANGAGRGNGSFKLVTDEFSKSGQLLVSHETGANGDMTVVRGDIDGDGAADFSISIHGRHDLTKDDFQY